jgi:phenylalanyl-tRNA synthetase alpha chain
VEENEIQKLAESLHPLERKALAAFQNRGRIEGEDLLSTSGLDEARLSMAVGWLSVKGVLTVEVDKVTTEVTLTDLGSRYLSEGLPGLRIVDKLKTGQPLTIEGLRKLMGPTEVSKAIGELKKANCIKIQPGGGLESAVSNTELDNSVPVEKWRKLKEVIETASERRLPCLEKIADEEVRRIIHEHASGRGKEGIFHLKEKRAQIYGLTDLGQLLVSRLPKEETVGEEIGSLTPQMLKDESWRGKRFRKYNIQLPPPRIVGGRKHPYRSFLDQVKQKFISMGFEEMRGPLVESEFWDMDALYMPQFHPAREIHDVYFVEGIDQSIPQGVIDRVAAAHRDGGETGSRGWRYPFDVQRTRRWVLRSQGTAVSARTLGDEPKIPGKYFSIARCFRYDQVDATHAPDFFQVEGIVLGEEIHFRTLLGLLTLFAKEVARAEEIKFLPAYFPFTEPSVEMHVRHPKLGWMELGGAGLFRPEVTKPLGVDVPVIAWGLGLDRMAMVALGISDIRDLFSPDLGFIREKRTVQEGIG